MSFRPLMTAPLMTAPLMAKIRPQVLWVACVATLAFTTTARVSPAGELNPSHVAADAKWLVHIDREALAELELVQELLEMYPEFTGTIRDWFQSNYGIDPQQDVRSLTMFSRDYRVYTGTVLIRTEYDTEKVKAHLQANDSLKKTQRNGNTFYTLTLAKHEGQGESGTHDHHDRSGGMQMTVFLGDDLIVLASSMSIAESTLRLLEGNSPSLEDSSPLVSRIPSGALIYASAIELERLSRYPMMLPLLKQQQQCTYAFGERDGKLFESMSITSKSNDVAEKTKEVMEGLIAYEQLCAAESKPFAELLSDVELTRDVHRLHVSWQGETELVVQAIRDLTERFGRWMKLVAN